MSHYNFIVREIRMDGIVVPYGCKDIYAAREKCEELQMIGDWLGTIAAEIMDARTGEILEVYDI